MAPVPDVRVDLDPQDADAGLLIEGDEEELRELGEAMTLAIERGEWHGALLDDAGVEPVLVRCVED